MRAFSSDQIVEKPVYEEDPRIPRFWKSRFVIFSIPSEVTLEQIHEAFKGFGVEEVDITYQSQEFTGNPRGGIAFVKVPNN